MADNKTENKYKVEKQLTTIFRRLKKNTKAVISLVIVALIILSCIFVPMFTGFHYNNNNATNGNQPPTSVHVLGTDQNGRDLLTRLFYGGRISLLISLTVVTIIVILGTTIGCASGFYGGWVDNLIMRICEIISSMPFTLMCILIIAVLGVPDKQTLPGLFDFASRIGLPNWKTFLLIITLSLLTWPGLTRIVRAQVLSIREMEYMEACEALGINDRSRMFKHILPNILSTIIVYATLQIASVILTETALSFLGLGVDPIMPTWGNLIQSARDPFNLQNRWWLWIPAGIMIFATVMCVNIFGDGLRDALDPKMKD